MFGLSKPTPISEWEAQGEIERTYHEIRQTLRVSGVNLNFRTWAYFDEFLPTVWDTFRANTVTRNFEEAADTVRAQAVTAACQFDPLDVRQQVKLGESQAYQVRAALDLYHYINPKLLVLTSAIRLALTEESVGGSGKKVESIVLGSPAGMYPMEMEPEDTADERLRRLFEDIQQTLGLARINSDYRTLALWPDYLATAWGRLKPITQRDEYRAGTDRLRQTARSLARQLPHRVVLDRKKLDAQGVDSNEVLKTTAGFEELLPGLIVNIALLTRDWCAEADWARSPFPARIAG